MTGRGDIIFSVVIYPGILGRSRRISPVNVKRAIPHPAARRYAPGPRAQPGILAGKEMIDHNRSMHTRVMISRIRIQGLLSDCMGFDGYLIVGDERFVPAGWELREISFCPVDVRECCDMRNAAEFLDIVRNALMNQKK